MVTSFCLSVWLSVCLPVACNHTRQSPAYVSTNRYVLELIYLLLNNQLKDRSTLKLKHIVEFYIILRWPITAVGYYILNGIVNTPLTIIKCYIKMKEKVPLEPYHSYCTKCI